MAVAIREPVCRFMWHISGSRATLPSHSFPDLSAAVAAQEELFCGMSQSKFRANVERSMAANPLLADAARHFAGGGELSSGQRVLITQNAKAFARMLRHIKKWGGRQRQVIIDESGPVIVPQKGTKRRAQTSKKVFDSFYSTEIWKRLRYQTLVSSNGQCSCCGASAADGATLRVDHIKPISRYPHLKADPSNLQVLCNDCNWGKGAWDETDWRSGPIHLIAANGRSIKP